MAPDDAAVDSEDYRGDYNQAMEHALLGQIGFFPDFDPARQPDDPEHAIIERCDSILKRSAGLAPITDDNMGEEWRFIQPDPIVARIKDLLGF